MFILEALINPTCLAISAIPTSNSTILSALKVILSSDIFKPLASSTNVLILLSIALLCFTACSLATEFSETRAASAANKNKVVPASTTNIQDLIDSDLHLSDSDDLMEEIEHELLPATKCSLSTGEDDENSAVCEAQSPKLTFIRPIAIQEDLKDDPLEPTAQVQQEQEQITPTVLEWFLQKDISPEDLDRLNYSQRARHFYLLKKLGEVKIVEEKPPEEQEEQLAEPEEELQVVHYDYQAQRFNAQLELEFIKQQRDTVDNFDDIDAIDDDATVDIVKQFKHYQHYQECQEYQQYQHYQQSYQPPPLVQNYRIPINVLSDLAKQADRIDIPRFQLSLLKMNCILNSSFLADQKYQFIQSQLKGADVIDYWIPSLPLSN